MAEKFLKFIKNMTHGLKNVKKKTPSKRKTNKTSALHIINTLLKCTDEDKSLEDSLRDRKRKYRETKIRRAREICQELRKPRDTTQHL